MDPADSPVHHIATLYRNMMRALNAEMAPLDMGSGRFAYLFVLYLHDGPAQHEIATRLQADKATVARTLAQLERQGYVRRVGDPDDRRQVRVYPTPRALALRGDLEEAVARVIARLQARLDPPRRELAGELLRTLAQALVECPPGPESDGPGRRRPSGMAQSRGVGEIS
ncbi:MAG: MarR family winged helix-turn-helix transcriptional regulator [Pseudomonadota bacterium]